MKPTLTTGIIIYTFLISIKYKKAIKNKLEKLNEFIDDKVEMINDVITTNSDTKLRNAKKLTRLFLSEKESYEYRKFYSKIENFRLKDFKKLFEGQFDYDNDDEINDFCRKYGIKDIKDFKSLILKFQNFQIILSEWYEDTTKNEYLKQLWHLYPAMYKLKGKNEKELVKELSATNYVNWIKDDKKTFKQCVENSPEIKAIEYNNYIENNIEEFGLLIGNCVQFNNSFKNYEGMKEFSNKSDKCIKNLLKKGLKFKNNSVDNSNTFKNAIEDRTINYIIKNLVKKVEKDRTIDNYYKKMINLMNNNKIKDFISLNDDLLSGLNTALSFFELGYHFLDLIHYFKELRDEGYFDYFNNELRKINENFENHKNEIKNIKGNDEKDFEIILSILKKIKKDRQDIFELIQNVNIEEDEELEKKNKNITNKKKITVATCFIELIQNVNIEDNEELKKKIKNLIDEKIMTVATFFTFGICSILIGVLYKEINVLIRNVNAIRLGKREVKLIKNNQRINFYGNLLKEMIQKQNENEKEIKLENLYIKIKYSHLLKDIQEKIKTKYSED